MNPSRPPSLADVALAAGVSTQTVSRVANGLTNVLPDTRLRVEQAMTMLGYRPNRAARALRSGRFHDLGVVLFAESSYGSMRTLEAITRAATAADHSVTVMLAERPEGRDVTQSLGRLHEQAVDGALLVMETMVESLEDLRLPVDLPVTVIASVPDVDPTHVDSDQEGGARSAVQHLLDLGHETVHHIRGPMESYAAAGRERAWRATLEAAGRRVPPVLLGDWGPVRGYEAGLELAVRPEVTAVFAANDHTALGVLRACHELGRSVPGSMSVAGFDDTPEAQAFWPPLTTVRQDFPTLGSQAVLQLLDRIAGREVHGPVLVETELVVRQSTARPPA